DRGADTPQVEGAAMRKLLSKLRLRVGLVGRFALAGLVAIALLGVVLGQVLRAEIRQRALVDARDSAELVDRSAVQPHLSAADLARGLNAREIARLDRALRGSLADYRIARIKVWNRDSRVVYATDPGIIRRRFPTS